jgi:hypothetical protein
MGLFESLCCQSQQCCRLESLHQVARGPQERRGRVGRLERRQWLAALDCSPMGSGLGMGMQRSGVYSQKYEQWAMGNGSGSGSGSSRPMFLEWRLLAGHLRAFAAAIGLRRLTVLPSWPCGSTRLRSAASLLRAPRGATSN